MSNYNAVKQGIPHYLAEIVPSVADLSRALSDRPLFIPVDTVLARFVTDQAFVSTSSPYRAHRFGPPLAWPTVDGKLAFTWLYLANSHSVAVWEAQAVVNNRAAGAGFYITDHARERGYIAQIRFDKPLRLWDLTGEHSSRLGIQDIVSSTDHEACHWLGVTLRDAMLAIGSVLRPDGFCYPSRRIKSANLIALGDWATADLFTSADISFERFARSEAHASLLTDPMLTLAPDGDTVG